MITSKQVKSIARKCGADLCGIASIGRFNGAPRGFSPRDIYPGTVSVIVIACRVPEGNLEAANPIPYTVSEEIVLKKVNGIMFEMSLDIENRGGKAVLAPSVPYDYWDAKNMEGRGLLSLKHAAYYAGLGVLGRNTLLYNRKYGSLLKLGALLTNISLEQDAIKTFTFCRDSCSLCLRSCPAGAIESMHVNQKKCRAHSEIKNKRGVDIYVCNICRTVCPFRAGIA